ncbi:FtsX-like permease family protein [Nocardioides scoriae]|uniref:FtsX-like permease family protein n=1 Tax=Nocardioides scoriae TaxID=642780 RepID=A0A1H1LCL4_9ACTN|nr:FtsX-like permease family protein [Nocardioides scoriae]
MMLLRRGGWTRPVLVAGCTAVVTALLLVAVSILLMPEYADEQLLAIVAESGTRGGVAFGAAILTVPLLLLLHQALRLGNAARERRLAGLRLAGATPGEVRLLGAGEVALPALAGAVLGVGLWWLLRVVLGGTPTGGPQCRETADYVGCTFSGTGVGLRLVPTTVSPPWWGVLLVVLGVALLGLVMGLATGRTVTTTPHGVTRRSTRRRPRPWGLVVLVVAAVLMGVAISAHGRTLADVGLFGALGLAVLGLLLLAPWTAYVLGRRAAGRVGDVPGLLAAQRLVADPRAAGRAGAAVGGIGLAAGAVAGLLGSLVDAGQAEAYYLFPMVLVAVCLVGALVVVSLSLAVHSAETLTDRQRSMASLHALGVPTGDIRASQVREGALVAVPMAVIGAALGGLGIALLDGGLFAVLTTLLGVAVTPWLALVAVRLAVRLTGPVAARVVDPEHLRTA